MSRNYQQSDEFRRDDLRLVEHMDKRAEEKRKMNDAQISVDRNLVKFTIAALKQSSIYLHAMATSFEDKQAAASLTETVKAQISLVEMLQAALDK